jgi:transglutaminase-like putative cysteine protease
VILLFLVLEIAVLSLEKAHWITPQPSLTLILVLSLLAAGLLIKSRLPGLLSHIIALILGGGVTAVQVVLLPASDTLAFAGFLSGLTWIMGYLATWYLIRRHNPWVAVVLGTVVVLINLSNLPDNYYYFFGLYFIAAIFLVIWTRMLKQHYSLNRPRDAVVRGLLSLGAILTCIVIVAVFTARVIPEVRIPQLQTLVAKNMLWKQDLENSLFNLFAKVPSKEPLNTTGTREGLAFGNTWSQKEQVDFIINSPVPSYWRVKLYDSYTSRGWENQPVDDQLLESLEYWDLPADMPSGKTITYSVTANIKTDVILTAGNYIASDTTTLVSTNKGDVMTIRMPRVIGPGEHYTVTSAVSSPSPEALASVSAGYPSSLRYQYVRLPADFPDSVRELSDELTSGLTTPYEKVVAIDAYLSQFPYSDEIEPPPPGTDSVEYFLFTAKSGFCVYYASAMVVMLRSADVPARLAVGYVPGDTGENPGEYILRSKHYHAWPQVYFSGYGWVDLEATPSGGTSEVAIEEPWVADATPVEYPNLDIRQPPGTNPMLYPILPPTLPTATEPGKTKPGGPLPFADELGQTLLVLSIIAVILLVLAIPFLIVRSVFSNWMWRVDRSNLAASVYARACRLAAMAGMAPAPQQTPQEFTAALASQYPQEAAALNDIARTYADTRFGGKDGKLELYEEAMVLKARRSVYNLFFNRMGWIRRLLRKSN